MALRGHRFVFLCKPLSSIIDTSCHCASPTLRESLQHSGRPYRVLYAFDPRRVAILLLAEMPLSELRAARQLTQESLAKSLGINQAAVSKMERRTDMYISTLRDFVVAMGGELEITARFPDGAIKIQQFQDAES